VLSKELRDKLKANKQKNVVKKKTPVSKEKTKRKCGYSVIIPAYKAHNFIKKCLDSIVSQEHFMRMTEYEILVGIDGCDRTLKELLNIQDKYPKLKLFYFMKNHGPYIVKNNLIKEAKYTKLIFFDSDDHMKKKMVSLIDSTMRRGFDICRFRYTNYEESEGEKFGKTSHRIAEGVTCHSSRVHEFIGGFESWPCGADTDFRYRASKHFRTLEIDTPLFFRRIHPESLTRRKDTGLLSSKRKKYIKIIENRKNSGYYKKLQKAEVVDVAYIKVENNGKKT